MVINALKKKIKSVRQPYAQVLVVFFAFTLMVVLSSYYMSDIVTQYLVENSNLTLDSLQTSIKADLQEPRTLLGSISHTLRSMILDGIDTAAIHEYMKNTANYMHNSEEQFTGFGGFYGYFNTLDGGVYLASSGWVPTPDFIPTERPWYLDAVANNGRIGYSSVSMIPSFIDTIELATRVVITYTVAIYDDDGQILGVVALGYEIDRITNYIVNTKPSEGSYGFLLSEQLEILAHPEPEYIGKPWDEINSETANFARTLELGQEISEYKMTNYKGASSVMFIRKIENDWYIGVIAPEAEFYSKVGSMRLILIALGAFLAVMLTAILLSITAKRIKADIGSRQKSNFLATISHEIRTPLNAILGIAEIQMHDETLSPKTKEALENIYQSGDTLLRIINDVLDLSKIEAGKMEINNARYEVASLINDVVHLNIMWKESKPIELKLHVDENTPSELIGDEFRIKQILNNILSNAFKYTESGVVSLAVNSENTAPAGSPTGGMVTLVLCVSDTGRGMTAEQVRKMFEEYSRFSASAEANRTTQGTGLGMNITQRLVSLMSGEIAVDSRPGIGTTVTVRLPQQSDEHYASGVIGRELAENLRQFRLGGVWQLKKTHIIREPMPYGSVLIVDDVGTNLYVAKGLLSPYGLSIETVDSGFEAIEKVKNGNVYDIIFMDHFMPKMDGIEATKIIRSMGYTQPIVALTANAVAGQAELFLENGFDSFISKPVDIRLLNDVLNKLIRDRQSAETITAARQINGKQIAGFVQLPLPVIDPEMARFFIKDAESAIAELENLYEKHNEFDDENWQDFIIRAHAMKSALIPVEQLKLSSLAFELERAGKEKNIAVITDKTPEFLDSLRTLVQKMKNE